MVTVTRTPTFSLTYLDAVRDVQYQMVAALCLLVWDLLLTLGDETEYVWRMRRCVFKWLYFYFRYFLLGAQMFHLVVLPTLSSGLMSDFLCATWYQYIVLILQVSSCAIEAILAIRVFALFGRTFKVGAFLSSLILLELGVAVSYVIQMPTLEYFEACVLPRPPTDLANPFGAVIITVQSIIMGMLVLKQVFGIRLGWGRTPLLSFLVRDATSYYGVGSLALVICSISLVVCGQNDLRMTTVLYWSLSLYSALGSRFILNMERYIRRHASDEEIELTTHITL